MDLLWERERVMLKKDSFLLADGGGDDVLMSLPLEERGGGEEVNWPRPPERLSMLGEVLAVLELWPEEAERVKRTQQLTEPQCSHDTNLCVLPDMTINHLYKVIITHLFYQKLQQASGWSRYDLCLYVFSVAPASHTI